MYIAALCGGMSELSFFSSMVFIKNENVLVLYSYIILYYIKSLRTQMSINDNAYFKLHWFTDSELDANFNSS